MKKINLLNAVLILSLLSSCGDDGNKNTDSTSEQNIQQLVDDYSVPSDAYAVVLTSNDVVYTYGIVGETFDLSSIYSKFLTSEELEYDCDDDGVSINGDTLTYNKKGVYEIEVSDGSDDVFTIKSIVNEDEASRLDYPYDIDLSSYTLREGSSTNISINSNKVTIGNATSDSPWTRITYEMDESILNGYEIDVDITINKALNNTRWLGLIFNDAETETDNYPFYQFDIRKSLAASNPVEVTYVYGATKTGSKQYSYPYQGQWANPSSLRELPIGEKIHMNLKVNGTKVDGSLTCGDASTSFTTSVTETKLKNIGFQTAGLNATFENIKITLDDSFTKKSNNDGNLHVNIDDEFNSLKPYLISTSKDPDLLSAFEDDGSQQFYSLLEGYTAYDIDGNKMNTSINSLLNTYGEDYIPNLEVEDEYTLNILANVLSKSFNLKDYVVWSKDLAILDDVATLIPDARRGYIASNNESNVTTLDEVGALCRKAGAHKAYQIMLESKYVTKEVVTYALGVGYTIVSKVDSSSNYELIKSAVAGCKQIIATVNKSNKEQADMLFDDDTFADNSLLQAPYLTGHRGAGTNGSNTAITLPENTIESYLWAFENGANAIEIDIHETKDHDLAIIHNESTGDYSNVNLTVRSSTMEELQAIPLKCGSSYSYDYHIPSFSELLDTLNSEGYTDKTIVIEIKDCYSTTGKMALEIAKEKGWYNRITFISFGLACCKEMYEYDSAVQNGFLNTVYRRDNAEFWSSVSTYLSQGVGLGSQYTNITAEGLQESNARGYIYWLWTFGQSDSKATIEKINDGNLAFTTNYVPNIGNNIMDLDVSCNDSGKLSVQGLNYKYESTNITDYEVIILSNNATYSNGIITKTNNEKVSFVIKAEVKWQMVGQSTNYTIYSDVIEY